MAALTFARSLSEVGRAALLPAARGVAWRAAELPALQKRLRATSG